MKAKVTADMNGLKARVAQTKQGLDAKAAEMRADDLKWEAAFAIDYALAAIEQAAIESLNAIDARMAADEANEPPECRSYEDCSFEEWLRKLGLQHRPIISELSE